MQPREATDALIRDVLGEDYLVLRLERYEMDEAVSSDGECTVKASLRRVGGQAAPVTIAGRGRGFVDAFCRGMLEHYAREFNSLETIRFSGFEVKGQLEASNTLGADANVVVRLRVSNSEGTVFDFRREGHSLVATAMAVITSALEYFINSERAFVQVYHAMSHAKDRGRNDLITNCTAQLSELVTVTSYSKVIEQIRREALAPDNVDND